MAKEAAEIERLNAELTEARLRIDMLEREVAHKQMQTNRLLDITKAINANIKVDELYKMFNDFLSWEMSVSRMALFLFRGNEWELVSSLGLSQGLNEPDFSIDLSGFRATSKLSGSDGPFLAQFDVVIPVVHKDEPLACALVGGLRANGYWWQHVQSITAITNVVIVAIENKRLAKNELLNKEIELASQIQKTLVPKSLPRGERYQFSSIYKPHFGVGGDYYDFIEFPDQKFAFCVADISGKGIAAALLMASFQASFHALVYRYKNVETGRLDLAALTSELNRMVNRTTEGDRFITFFIGEFCWQERVLTYVNAGHVPPVLLQSSGEITLLETGSTVIGAFEELPFIETGRIVMPGEALILGYTDGLTDVRNDEDEEFSDAKLYAFLRAHAHLPVVEFNTKLLAAIEAFRGQTPLPDDITVLTCKLAGP